MPLLLIRWFFVFIFLIFSITLLFALWYGAAFPPKKSHLKILPAALWEHFFEKACPRGFCGEPVLTCLFLTSCWELVCFSQLARYKPLSTVRTWGLQMSWICSCVTVSNLGVFLNCAFFSGFSTKCTLFCCVPGGQGGINQTWSRHRCTGKHMNVKKMACSETYWCEISKQVWALKNLDCVFTQK